MLNENGRRVAIKRGLCAVDVAVALVLILLVILDCCSNVVGRSCNAGVVVCVIAPVDGDAVAWGAVRCSTAATIETEVCCTRRCNWNRK